MTNTQENQTEENENPPAVQDLLRAVGALNLGDDPPPEARQAVLDAVVERLAGAEAFYVEQVRNELVHRVRLPANEVDARLRVRSRSRSDTLQGEALALEDPEPWPDPVDGNELLFLITQVLTRFLVLPTGTLVIVPLWVLGAHSIEAFFVFAYLAVTSPVMRCGKSTLLLLLSALCPRAMLASNLTPAATFRVIDRHRPTLLIDEADTFLDHYPQLRGVLNAGHARLTAWVWRIVGDDHEARRFNVFCAKAIAKIGRLTPTLADRSIEVRMRRKAPSEDVERLRLDRLSEFETILRKAARWALDNRDALRRADPEVPPELGDREADNFRPLFAIADEVGGSWPEKAREAAVCLCAKLDEDTTEEGVKLLADIRDVFDEKRAERLATGELLYELAEQDRQWKEHSNGNSLTNIQLARLLRPFEIRPKDHWFPNIIPGKGGGKVFKGYERVDFEDAWRRYLPTEPVDADPQDPQEAKDDKAS